MVLGCMFSVCFNSRDDMLCMLTMKLSTMMSNCVIVFNILWYDDL